MADPLPRSLTTRERIAAEVERGTLPDGLPERVVRGFREGRGDVMGQIIWDSAVAEIVKALRGPGADEVDYSYAERIERQFGS